MTGFYSLELQLADVHTHEKKPDISYQGISGLVGAEGFEPSAFCSRSKRATRLRYAPIILRLTLLRGENGRYYTLYFFRCQRPRESKQG